MTHACIEKWSDARFWLWDLVHIQWKAPTRLMMLELSFFGGDSERDIGLSIGTWLFYLHISLQGVLPRSWVPKTDYKVSFGEERTVGIRYFSSALWFDVWADQMGSSREQPWYMKTISVDMPWSREWVRTSVLLKDATWDHETPQTRKQRKALKALPEKEAQGLAQSNWRDHYEFLKANRWSEDHPYKYVLRSGEEQHVTATIGVEEREWRPKWFKWTNLFAQTSRTIKVDFSDEVGEETGSWKGGTVGCGYELRPDETPLACLRRMEQERKF